jgi:anti-sigma B factor antagonist
MLEIKVRQRNGVIVLDLGGRIDVDAANFIEAVGYFVHNAQTDILCNLEDVEYIDYMGVSVITVAYKEVINNQGRMKFVNVPTHLKGVFGITGLEEVFEIYASEDSALNSFKEDKIIEKIKQKKLRRRFKRLPVELKVRYRSKCLPESEFLEGEVLDLSGVGAYIFGPNKFPLGETLVLRMRLIPKQSELEVEAKVVWLSDKQIQPVHHPGTGVEFYNISSSTQKEILEFIERNMSFSPSDT